MGVGKRLKEFNREIKVIGVEPFPKSKISGLRNMGSYKPSIFDEKKLDGRINVDERTALKLVREIFKKEGISVGISSGAALYGALMVAEKIKKGNIVTLFPDRGERYLSTGLFRP